jgi:hypothetical protein
MNFILLMYAFLEKRKFDLLSYEFEISRINKEKLLTLKNCIYYFYFELFR